MAEEARKSAYMLDANESIVIAGMELRAPLGRVVLDGIELRTIAKRNGKALLNIYATPGLIERIERTTQPSPQLAIVTRRQKIVDSAKAVTVGFSRVAAACAVAS